MVIATELKKGMIIKDGGELYTVLEVNHVTPGNWRGYVQASLRSLTRGNKNDKRYRSTEDVEEMYKEEKKMEYLYPENDDLIFMDQETYDQIPVSKDLVGTGINFLMPNTVVQVLLVEGLPAGVTLPVRVSLIVTSTEPGIRGDSRSNITKAATVETGVTVRVPLHIKEGDKIKINTETGEFVERDNS